MKIIEKKEQIENVTIGTDPEFFLINKETGKYVPSIGLIGGSKYDPRPITNNGHCIQEDNVMVEFNVPPARSANDLWKDVDFVKNFIKNEIIPKNLDVVIKPSVHFDIEDLKSEQAQTFGCEPDFNAWELEMNSVKMSDETLRVAGGHLHIGYNKSNEQSSIAIVRSLDLFLGVQSVILDSDTERKKMYGKAGAMRFKSFGCEYRVLSNFWIENEQLTHWTFNIALEAIEFANVESKIDETLAEKVINCINNQDKELAYWIYQNYHKPNELVEQAYSKIVEEKFVKPSNLQETFKILTS